MGMPSSKQENSELLTCQKLQEEISLNSIFSALLDRVELAFKLNEDRKFKAPAKHLPTKNQAIIFEEKLYISRLTESCCQLSEKKIFLESELQEIGSFKFKVEQSYEGYLVCSKSQLLKKQGKLKSGHWIKSKYDHNLNVISEKRSEYDFVDKARREKSLDACLKLDKLIVKRKSKIGNDTQYFKAIINVKDRKVAFILEGGVLLLIRFLIASNFFGDFNYFSMNVVGKVLRCQLNIYRERRQIKIFQRTFKNAIHVRNTQYFNDKPQEVSDTYYTAAGKMILHYWYNFNYIFHETKRSMAKQEILAPKLELMWRTQNQLSTQYRLKENLIPKHVLAYFG